MKKTLLLGLLLLGGLTANAQYGLPDGTLATDFTVTDLEGTEHHLQTYLDEGKTVVLYCSATWCGPCWNFHNTHILSYLHNSFGPETGSDELIILYVESDPYTPVDHITGGNSPAPNAQGPTWGDWTEGTPYPIINSDFIGDEYFVNAFPIIYRICPQGEGEQGVLTQIERESAADMVVAIEGGCNELNGVPNWAGVETGELRMCESTGSPKATIINYGGDITEVTLELKLDGAVVATETFEVDLGVFEGEEVAFESMEFDAEADYEVVISSVNGGEPVDTIEAYLSSEFTVTPNAPAESPNNVTVTVYTDNYPGEMEWKIFDSTGEKIAGVAYTGPANGGGANANTVKVHKITLPEGIDCLSIEQIDDYGDGWVVGNGDDFGMVITAGWGEDGEVLFENDGNIGLGKITAAAMVTTGELGNEEFNSEGFAIYPNPSAGVFNFATQEAVDVTVLDITGKIVHVQEGIVNGGSMNLGNLQSGMYVAKIKNANGAERIEKLMVK